MDIIQICSIGIISMILAVTIKKDSPVFSVFISIIAGVLIFFIALPKLNSVILMIDKISQIINVDSLYIDTVLKVIGIAYIAQFSSQICLDAGEGAVASKIELGGKILMMVISTPIIMGLIDLVITMLP